MLKRALVSLLRLVRLLPPGPTPNERRDAGQAGLDAAAKRMADRVRDQGR